jgi:alkylation response protein AidB-like acyl-CoA dehydrogenase
MELIMSLHLHTRALIGAAFLAGFLLAAAGYELRRIAHARQPEGCAQSLAYHPDVRRHVAEMSADLEAARLITYRSAWLSDKEGPTAETTAALYRAKYMVGEAVSRITRTALTLGGSTFPSSVNWRRRRGMSFFEGDRAHGALIRGPRRARSLGGTEVAFCGSGRLRPERRIDRPLCALSRFSRLTRSAGTA